MLKRIKDRLDALLERDMIQQKDEYEAWLEEQASIAESLNSFPHLEEYYEREEG